jgi:ribonucleoside-diphosphate reductase alpha chain
MEEWLTLIKSKSGERGIFNRDASQRQAAKWGRRDNSLSYGTNPCSEIILRDKQFCNLTEVVVRSTDTMEELKRKVELATILGTIQSTLTSFQFLSEEWKKNTEEERLLGVSLTGIMDHPFLSGQPDPVVWGQLGDVLKQLKGVAVETNKEWAKKLGINASVAITCVKPSGTVSQLVDSSSGIHPRFAPYYVRTVRSDNKDPLTLFLKEQGVPWEPAMGKEDSTTVFSFPMKAPEGSIIENKITAMDQLELWKVYQEHWCEHKPSITVYYKNKEFPSIVAWIWDNFDSVSGISFLPKNDHNYKQAPYQEITRETYVDMVGRMPKIDWDSFSETQDNTISMQTLACSSGQCEL